MLSDSDNVESWESEETPRFVENRLFNHALLAVNKGVFFPGFYLLLTKTAPAVSSENKKKNNNPTFITPNSNTLHRGGGG